MDYKELEPGVLNEPYAGFRAEFPFFLRIRQQPKPAFADVHAVKRTRIVSKYPRGGPK
jgi:hypothetical protein